MSRDSFRAAMCLRTSRLGCFLVLVGSLFCLTSGVRSAQPDESAQEGHAVQGMDMDHHDHTEEVFESMIPHRQHTGPHMKWTVLRSANGGDRQRADEIVRALRKALVKYRDYRVAISDGYVPRHPERKQPHYYFANNQHRFMARLHFDPAEPTAILYTKTEEGYELEGAMYTAPRGMTEAQLNERVPLSVAQWHAHINLCFPTEGSLHGGSRKQFGFKGTIATESECQQAGGRFVPQLGGWMIHIYPFKATPAEIWTH